MMKRWVKVLSVGLWGVVGLGAGVAGAGIQTQAPVYDGPFLDYQPAPLRSADGGLWVAIERLNTHTNSGDLYLTRSRDDGATWEEPTPIVASPLTERHPSLVQLADGSFSLFYMVGEGGGVYHIHRSISPDGGHWSERGALELGWSDGKEINPSVIREADGSLTMTYQRLNGAAYLARSTDGGETWDTRQTQISEGWAALPRVARRESDGLYVVTYQVDPGNGNQQILSKTSFDPYDWRSPPGIVSRDANGHDSQPLVLEDGTFFVTYAEQSGSDCFDLYSRTSDDGRTWSSARRITTTPTSYDIQPHPLLQGTPGFVSLFWSFQKGDTPYINHDILMMRDLPIDAAPRLSEYSVM